MSERESEIRMGWTLGRRRFAPARLGGAATGNARGQRSLDDSLSPLIMPQTVKAAAAAPLEANEPQIPAEQTPDFNITPSEVSPADSNATFGEISSQSSNHPGTA